MTAPDDLPYGISGREIVADADGMRVQILTLARGEQIPWHRHTSVADVFVGVEGTTVIETGAPSASHELGPGQHAVVPPGTAHTVSAKDANGCRFTLVQGVGEHDFIELGDDEQNL